MEDEAIEILRWHYRDLYEYEDKYEFDADKYARYVYKLLSKL